MFPHSWLVKLRRMGKLLQSKYKVPAPLRRLVMQRDRHICQMCGITPADRDPFTRRRARMTVGYFVPPEEGGHSLPSNLRTICSTCAEGLAELQYVKRPTAQDLIRLLEKTCELDPYKSTAQLNEVAAKSSIPFPRERTGRLTMGHIVDKSKGGDDSPGNLRAVCTNCNEGLQNAALPKPSRVWLLSQARRATVDDQKAVLAWLQRKFAVSRD